MTASRMRARASSGALPRTTRVLCEFAAAMARGREASARVAIAGARRARARRRELTETALMLMLYAGFPGALEGLRVLNAAWPGSAARTRGPAAARRSSEGSPGLWRKRGEALCRRVYGPAYERLLPAVRALHPDLAVWMVEHGYGRVLARPGLGLRERELVTVAALAALGWERQLVSHVLGAARVGADTDAIREALRIGAGHAGARERAAAARTFKRAIAYLAREGAGRAGRMIRPRSTP